MSNRNQESTRPAPSRRAFIKGLGVAVGSSVVLGPATFGCADAAVGETVAVGMLVPDSHRYPAYFDRVTSGAYLGFAHEAADVPLELTVDTLPSKGAPRIDHLREFVRSHDIDVLILAANPMGASGELCASIERLGVPVIVVDAGFSIATDAVRQSAWLFSNTLGGWQSNWLAGAHAAREFGPRGQVLLSMYDASNDGLLAFQAGFSHGGGRDMQFWIPEAPAMNYDLDAALDAMAANEPDFVFLQSHLDDARLQAAAIRQHAALSDTPIVASSSWLVASDGPGIAGLRSVATTTSWHAGSTDPDSESFVRRYRSTTGAAPDGLALLGYETARWVASAARSLPRGAGRSELRDALASVRFAGPRGSMRTDKAGAMQHGFARIEATAGEFVERDRVKAPAGLDTDIRALLPEIRTGSTNAYLAI